MVKKSTLLLTAAILLSGCTREVYLQAVPCAEGNCDCPCVSETRECCPETQMLTETIQYQVIDGPVVTPTYTPCCPQVTPTYTPCNQKTKTITTTTTTTTTRKCTSTYCTEVVY